MTDDTRRRTARLALPLLGLTLAAALLPALSQPATAATPKPVKPVKVVKGDTVPKVTDLGPTSFAKRGPYAVGEVTLNLPTNQAPVEVWYPTKKSDAKGKRIAKYNLIDWLPDFFQSALPKGAAVTYPSGGVRRAPVAPGRFPLVVFSHGFAGYRDQSSFLTAYLASWGFVVAAPDHHSRDLTKVLGGPAGTTTDVEDLQQTITLMRAQDRVRKGRFAGHVDTLLVGAVGHSAGGGAVQEFAAADRRVTTFVGLAPATREGKQPRQPGLFMAGTSDGIISSDKIVAAYDNLRSPKRLVLVGGGHHAFSDLCEVGSAEGGLLEVAEMLHVPVSDSLKQLATDGCEPPALPPTKAWPAIRQTVVAQLRHVFGFDRSLKGLRGLKAAFPGVVEGSRAD
ncbi:alpha/beta hydrolase family protein [Nocardioides conyzicola]|uniref:PET hydrolase/cutinase-like domain-containing protein n=1 Tax=Nocardioides conyzicola TaxID=1651781 RepID=A0ABP8XPR1_9ACTN